MFDAFNLNHGQVAVASFDHKKSLLRLVAGEDGFGVAEMGVGQVKIGRNSCFAKP